MPAASARVTGGGADVMGDVGLKQRRLQPQAVPSPGGRALEAWSHKSSSRPLFGSDSAEWLQRRFPSCAR